MVLIQAQKNRMPRKLCGYLLSDDSCDRLEKWENTMQATALAERGRI